MKVDKFAANHFGLGLVMFFDFLRTADGTD